MNLKPQVAVVGAGIVGICSAFFLQKNGFQVTLIDKKPPGSMTSYGHACTFADYACVPVNSPDLFTDIPSMLLRSDGPLAVDFFHVLKNLNWVKQIEHFPFKCTARIRYNSIGAEAVLMNENNQIICKFSKPQLAITPGQSMVFYINDSMVGGGIIEK